MGEKDFELGAGTLYFKDMEMDVGYAEMTGIGVVEEVNTPKILSVDLSGELSFTTKCTFNKWTLYKLTGIYKAVIDGCPNRRVAHLIKYGKNDRVRHKNFNRAVKIINESCLKSHLITVLNTERNKNNDL